MTELPLEKHKEYSKLYSRECLRRTLNAWVRDIEYKETYRNSVKEILVKETIKRI